MESESEDKPRLMLEVSGGLATFTRLPTPSDFAAHVAALPDAEAAQLLVTMHSAVTLDALRLAGLEIEGRVDLAFAALRRIALRLGWLDYEFSPDSWKDIEERFNESIAVTKSAQEETGKMRVELRVQHDANAKERDNVKRAKADGDRRVEAARLRAADDIHKLIAACDVTDAKLRKAEQVEDELLRDLADAQATIRHLVRSYMNPAMRLPKRSYETALSPWFIEELMKNYPKPKDGDDVPF